MTVAWVKEVGTVNSASASTTNAVTVAAGGVPVDDYCVAFVAADNSGVGGIAQSLTVTDPRANTWTVEPVALFNPGFANQGAVGYIAWSRISSALVAGDVITFTWGVSTTNKAVTVQQFTGVAAAAPVVVQADTTQTAGITPSVVVTPTAVGQLVCALAAVEGGSSDTFTADADTTDGAWVAITRQASAGPGASGISVIPAYKIVTGTSPQTYSPTLGTARDSASKIVVFAAAVVAPVGTPIPGTYSADQYGAATYGGFDPADLDPTWLVQVQQPGGEWLDVTCDVRSIDIDRGRTTYSDSFRSGTLTVELANPTGKYSTFPAGNIWLQPGGFTTDVPIRAGAVYHADVSWRFTGTTDRVDDAWPGTVDARAVVTASDAFKGLARNAGVVGAVVGAGELSGARVHRHLDAAFYAGARAIDAGSITLSGTDGAGVTLDLLRQVGESEWGWLYVRGDGTLTFRQRDAATTDPRMTTVQYIFTDTHALAGACYGEATTIGADDAHVITAAQITPVGHPVTSTYEDAAARAWFGRRTYTRTDLPINLDVDAAALAQLVVTTYKADDRRIDSVSIDGANHPENYGAAFGCRLLDRIRFVRTMPGGWQVDADLLVHGRRDTVIPDGDGWHLATWDVTFTTASALLIRNLGRWDVGRWDEAMWGV